MAGCGHWPIVFIVESEPTHVSQDAEVKQCAISGMADIISVIGDQLVEEL
eukprot:SAG11_NODE_35785_length_265_cov_0.608434_1_plen_49_part_01